MIRSFSSRIHVDVDDGIFAPHLTWPYTAPGAFTPFDLDCLQGLCTEVHVMADKPREVGEAFARAGAACIIAHLEVFADADEARGTFRSWKQCGAKEVGLALLYETPLEGVAPLIPEIDLAHLMSIDTIGTQNIPFEPKAPERVARFRALYRDTSISVDGGVSKDNIGELIRAGATRFGVGSAIMRASNPAAAYEELKHLAEKSA